MFLNRCFDNSEENLSKGNCCHTNYPMNCQPIMECPQENICHRTIFYDVEHVIPINTRVINHHVYKHHYTPCYTCTQEDEFCNVYDKYSY